MRGWPIGAAILIAVAVFILCSAYMAPAYVAELREHHNFWPIFILNLFLGGSFIGWIGAFVWSLSRLAPTTSTQGDMTAADSSQRPASGF